jgi:hypothetical protein
MAYCTGTVTAQINETTAPPVTVPTAPSTNNTPTGAVPTETPSGGTMKTCFTNLREVQSLIGKKDPFIKVTYVLCPDTVFGLSDVLLMEWNP